MKLTMIRRTSLLIAALALVIGFSNGASAQETKIGYVNPQSILANMPEMKAVQQRLQNLTARKQQELYDKEAAFQQEVAAYQQKIGVISAEAQQQEEARLTQLQNDLGTAQQAAELEIQQRREQLLGPLLEQIGNAIDEVASELELTYVLNTTTSTGDLVILYVSEEYRTKYDITQKVPEIQRLHKGAACVHRNQPF